jgi:hypothetical protein
MAQTNEGTTDLSAHEISVVKAPAGVASELIPFHVEVNGRDADGFDVTVSNAAAVVSIILPNGTEVNISNAASFGFEFELLAADSDAVTIPLLMSNFSLAGTHASIRLPSTSPSGTYQVKINNSSVSTDTLVSASYITGSPIKVALASDRGSYTVGTTVVLSAFVFNGTMPVTNATVDVLVMDQTHPEISPTSVTMTDSGSHDAAQGDGIYTGTYSAATGGKFIAGLRVSGTSPGGAAYVRNSATDFRILPPLASFTTFSDAGVDDNGNGLFDRVVVTANLQVQQAGVYRLELTLVASNSEQTQANTTVTLSTGAQQMTVAFTAKQIAELGVNGPYTIKNATLYHTSDPEEPIAAFSENGGQTTAYALSSLERPVLKFTGNNTVSGIDTNSNGKFDLLRIQVELNTLTAATYDWSGTLKDSAGKTIQSLDATSTLSVGSNTLTFDFDGIKIAENGVNGPYTLGSVLVFNPQNTVHEPELLKTQAFSVNDFECSDAPATTVQSLTLTPTSVIGGNATTLHVTLAQVAGSCGAKVTVTSNNPAVIAAAIPATIIVPAGQNFADFTVITAGVASASQVNLTATSGASSQSASLNIAPSTLSNISLSFPTLQAGTTTAGKVELDGAAPLGGATVPLLSSNSAVASVPANVVIPAGQRSVEFVVNTNPQFEGSAVVNINATLGSVAKTAGLTVYSEVFSNGSITPGGAAVTVTATEPGQNFFLAFTGTAGQRISLRLAEVTVGTSSCCGAYVSIKKPDGSYLINPTQVGTSGGFIDATALPVTGAYTIIVDPIGTNVGSVSLTLYDVPADVNGSVSINGAPVTVTTTVPGQNARLTFDAAVGEQITVRVTGNGIGGTAVTLSKPDGTTLTSVNSSSNAFNLAAQTLTVSGSYVVQVDPNGSNIGNITLTLYDPVLANASNLAFNKTATQSSTNWDAPASRAVDGNTDGDFSHNSVTHTQVENQAWWQVDLGSVESIGNISVWNRTDCCSSALTNFYVFVSDVPFTSADLTTTQNQAGVWTTNVSGQGGTPTTLGVNRTGRYVRVQLAGSDRLSLAEVQVWAPSADPTPTPTPNPNLAEGKQATQSSTNWSAPANRAVDGNTDGDFSHNSVTHTQVENQAWWQVDLASVQSIGTIKVWNRTDCCGDALSNFYVFVSDAPFTSTDLTSTQNQSGVSTFQVAGQAGSPTTINVNRSGRYVRVQLAGVERLSLAEVQVLSPSSGPPDPNLALNKTATQSSTNWSAPADRAVDGNTDGDFSHNSVTHTQVENQAWWQVDLESVKSIGTIKVWNRTDCCGDALTNFYVFVSDTPFTSTDLASTQNQAGVSAYQVTGQAGTPTTINVNRSGRYVRVQLVGTDRLSLAELQVLGP